MSETFLIGWATTLTDTRDWLQHYGYRCLIAGIGSELAAGVVFARPNEPAYLAMVGDLLHWDHTNVTVVNEEAK